MTVKTLSPRDARALLHDGGEFAFLDVREILPFSRGHPYLAANVPWSRFEPEVAARVPRRTTRIVLSDDRGELAPRAARRLAHLGYTDVAVLEGGAEGWAGAGFALIPEVEVPAKGFGAFARVNGRPPYISPRELHAKLASDEDWIVLDSRPMDEYRLGNIPGSIDAPGADMLRCFDDLVPDPRTKVCVNCMSATRGTLGGLSLLAAGVPNEVYVLHHGTRGWLLDGLELETGASRVPGPPSPGAIDSARRRAAAIRERAGIPTVSAQTLARWRADAGRTTWVFDVRTPAEYEAGHVAGARNAPEGRLVMAVEEYLATRNARIVLADDDTCRATVNALWLAQMGMGEVAVAEESGGFPVETGPEPEPGEAVLTALRERFAPRAVDARTLAGELEAGRARVIDVGHSEAFRAGHVPGARWATRSAVDTPDGGTPVVLTSEDGAAALLAAVDRIEAGDTATAWLEGGNTAWAAAGRPLEPGEAGLDGERVDRFLASSERPGDVRTNVVAYLDWETQLLDQITAAGEAPYRNLIW